MTYAEAQVEFSIRLYRWAKVALEKEMLEGLPRLQFSNEWSNLRCRYIQTLDPQSKIVFGQGLLQMRHQNAVKALGEVSSTETQKLIRREEAFRSENNSAALAFASGANVGKPIFATRRELKKAISSYFRTAFGDKCLPPDPLDGKNDLRFMMECRGWIIETEFEFGRWVPGIMCSHNVWTGRRITKDEPQVLFANSLGVQLNYGNELGIGSGWEDIAIDEVESKCRTVIEHCRIMFELFPVLLENLDQRLLTRV